MLEWLRFQSLGTRDYIVERLGMMFMEYDSQKVLVGLFILSFGLGGSVFVFMALKGLWVHAAVFGLIATVVGWKAPRPFVDWLYRRRVDKFVGQMIDGLNLMSNGLKSGLTVIQSMGLVVEEMPKPIREEFGMVLSENKLGMAFEDALNRLAKRVQSDELEMFVTAINILKETGGNLAETFDTISVTIRERIKMEKKIGNMVAMAKNQGLTILAIPPLIGIMFYNSDPEFMEPLVTQPMGLLALLLVLVLEVVGYFLIMRIVKVRV
jgi:tight adherence protein B